MSWVLLVNLFFFVTCILRKRNWIIPPDAFKMWTQDCHSTLTWHIMLCLLTAITEAVDWIWASEKGQQHPAVVCWSHVSDVSVQTSECSTAGYHHWPGNDLPQVVSIDSVGWLTLWSTRPAFSSCRRDPQSYWRRHWEHLAISVPVRSHFWVLDWEKKQHWMIYFVLFPRMCLVILQQCCFCMWWCDMFVITSGHHCNDSTASVYY